ncbi:MAG: hypothetical protein HC871_10780 [Rhizobiales bacterium]|nr:hypothetical protein [Hyphomicrobiales bacterium]
MCDAKRQEFILLSDVLGATARVDLINHRFPAGATQNSVLGPFFMENRPLCANGDDISGGQRGEPMFFSGRVLDGEGRPVVGARVDIWHSDGIGAYDVMMPDLDAEYAMRGLFRADAEGRFWFSSITPISYPIPLDGTVGELMRATSRSRRGRPTSMCASKRRAMSASPPCCSSTAIPISTPIRCSGSRTR